MKRRELEAVVRNHGKRIAKHAKEIPGLFPVEDIHDLRVEYKKLRAFLRLVQLDPDAGRNLKMPADLKALYRSAGTVRDLQLFIPAVQTLHDENDSGIPIFMQNLRQQLFRAKEQLIERIEEADIEKSLNEVVDKMPSYLQDTTTRQFIHLKIAAIQILLLAVDRDEELHAIRKHLKDIFYVIKIFENDWGISFPIVAWRNEKMLSEVMTLLGDYNDRCVTLLLLADAGIEELPEAEQSILLNWQQTLEVAKRAQQQEVLQAVQDLQLISNF